MSPEQVLNRDIGPQSDVFSLGGLLHHAAVGSSPFGGTDPAIFHRITDVEPDLSGIPPDHAPSSPPA